VKVKIFGAGSIGNHLANASRRLDWQVDVVDIDLAALKRMREEIYPTSTAHGTRTSASTLLVMRPWAVMISS
jgi:pyruvate/2-oxoglutarate dehydrogenase complex dihydrolipoamide dehydrogenase (E3) component